MQKTQMENKKKNEPNNTHITLEKEDWQSTTTSTNNEGIWQKLENK